MTSNVIVGIPSVVPFQQSVRKRREVLNIEISNAFVGSTATDPVLRVAQLEANIRFLQEQHQVMLSGLHKEIEVLRQRNRDLQMQFVFQPQTTPNSTTSSPEEEPKKLSPTNNVPLQIEILQHDISKLKLSLEEEKNKNCDLQKIIEDKKHDSEKLEDAERVLRKLRRENEEQRKEIISLRSITKTKSDRNSSTNRPRTTQSQFTQTSRFPPVYQQQTYWNTSNPLNNASNSSNSSKNNLDHYKKGRNNGINDRASTVLPHLRSSNGSSTTYYNNFHRRSYNNQHRRPQEGGFKNYRQFHRDFGEP